MIHSQQLTQRLRIERQPQPATSFDTRQWELVAQVWGSVRPARSREAVAADAMQATLTHSVIVRWSPALDVPLDAAQWRITYTKAGRQRVLAIVGPGRNVKDRNEWMAFDCIEGAADGH